MAGGDMSADVDLWKRQAAEEAVLAVASGMVVGLGHGSTAVHAVRRLAGLLRRGELRDVLGVACSRQVEAEAGRLSIPLVSLDDHPVLDLAIDGADEVAPNLDLIKGGGGAMLREKIVAQAARREIIVVDQTKLSPRLGTRSPVPVEVFPFGLGPERRFLENFGQALGRDLGAKVRVRVRAGEGGIPFRTDAGNLVLDCDFGPIADPAALAAVLDRRAAVAAHGLFLGLAAEVLVAGPEGVRRMTL